MMLETHTFSLFWRSMLHLEQMEVGFVFWTAPLQRAGVSFQFVLEKLAKLELKRRPRLRMADKSFFFLFLMS